MYFKIANGLIVDSPRPIKLHDMAHYSHVLRRITGDEVTPDTIELLTLKCRYMPFDQSPFWAAFKGMFPSAQIIHYSTGDVIQITDAFDCINFTFKLQH
jgi:hypothetical protein